MSGLQSVLAANAWWQKDEEAGYTVSLVRTQRHERGCPVLLDIILLTSLLLFERNLSKLPFKDMEQSVIIPFITPEK